MIGKVVSHYEIVEPLGAGGMGVVYKALDQRLDRFVALKFLPPQLGIDDAAKLRFVNEARAASALDHANICTIHEIDEDDDGQLFIVMAFYEGESLKERIERGPMPPLQVVDLGVQIAAGLGVAHERGILHRDIKPANLFITSRGEVKILDFGLAKITGVTKMTRTGTSMGTLNYMAPEQLRGRPVDARADVWAVASVLYEMLTGQPAFGGDNEGAVVYAILEAEPLPVSEISPAVPRELASVLERCLAKPVEDRPASVDALRIDLLSVRDRVEAVDEQPTQIYHESSATDTRSSTRTPREPAGSAIAVIDFSNIAGDPTADWLSGGIAETLSVDLKKISSLSVVGRQKIQTVLAGQDVARLDEDELRPLAGRLGARWLCWGGFQKMADAIRLTTHCFDLEVGQTVATVKLDGSMSEIFHLQDEILKVLLEALDLPVTDSEVRELERPATEDLEAFEYCAKARELSFNMRPEDFGAAAEYLHTAIELDPEYALAYSSLGQLHCFQFIGSTDRHDLTTAIENLQRAVELDPELGDSYGWLSYAYSRDGRHRDAIASGRRAVEVEWDNPQSHYFLAVALWLRGMDEFAVGGYTEAIEHLREVNALVPRYQPGFQIQGAVHLHCGRYEQARELLEIAADIEESGDYELGKFVGAIGLLARVAYRQGKLDEAAELLDRAFRVSGRSVHVYTPACNALAHCWQGDLLMTRRRRDEALRAFRAAQEQVAASPRSLGIGWAQLRAHVGLASGFHQLGMRRESLASFESAVELMASKQGYDFSGIWDTGEAQIQFELGCYLALSRRIPEALAAMEEAVERGWMESPRLRSDPMLAAIRGERRFQRIEARLAGRRP